jgi:hypothetical protein
LPSALAPRPPPEGMYTTNVYFAHMKRVLTESSKYTVSVYNAHMNRVHPDRRQASGDLFPTDEPIPASQMIGRS